MESLAKTLNAIKEVTIGDKVYKLSSVTLNDLAAYESYLKSQQCKDILALDIPKKEMYPLISAINREGIDPDELSARLLTISGIRFLVWRLVSKRQDDVTIEQIGDDLDLQNMNSVVEAILDLTGETQSEDEQGEKK
tara:strand:- start:279 stop:689 length:411 start_codon:yes stop_codon:yes gene_type:complete